MNKIIQGDCIEEMKKLPDNSVDAIITDPPYDLVSINKRFGKEGSAPAQYGKDGSFSRLSRGFMGKQWDGTGIAFKVELWKEALRILKPGGFLLSMGGTRTYHRMVCAVEDAGFSIRDTIMWLYGCLSEDTEILTDKGWERYHRNIYKYPILIYDVENDIYKWEIPEKWKEYKINDTCYRIQSDNTDQLVSKNHRVAVEQDGRIIFKFAETLECEENIPFLESVPSLSKTLSDLHERTSSEEKMLLSKLCELFFKIKEKKTNNLSYKKEMSRMWKDISITKEKTIKMLLKQMQRYNEKEKSLNYKTSKENSPPWKDWLDRERIKDKERKNDGVKESSMERWSDLFQNSWELFGSEICEMSKGVYRYGEKGWLCNGTPIINGEEIEKELIKNRSCASQRPQSREQSDREFSSIQDKQGTQDTRGIRIEKAKVTKQEYSGLVFCPTVSTGCFVARRKGKIFITGNSGFPKSLNVGKQIDKMNGRFYDKGFQDYCNECRNKKGYSHNKVNELMGSAITGGGFSSSIMGDKQFNELPTLEMYNKLKSILEMDNRYDKLIKKTEAEREVVGKDGRTAKESIFGIGVQPEWDLTKASTPEAKQWEGWGTALKPACEPIVVARKPLSEKNVALNVLKWGTGGINIDDCRIGYTSKKDKEGARVGFKEGEIQRGQHGIMMREGTPFKSNDGLSITGEQGRFPANIILDEEAGRMLDEQSGELKSGDWNGYKPKTPRGFAGQKIGKPIYWKGDKGGASRFFYCAKASKSERNEGMEDLEPKQMYKEDGSAQSLEIFGTTDGGRQPRKNNHPTVKPIKLMEYLIKLVSKEGAVVLDPFLGSGTTAIACLKLNRKFIGIEKEEEYVKIAKARIKPFLEQEKL